jgi:hypothetical protein
LHVKQVFGAVLRGAAGRMQRKSEECQSTHALQGIFRLATSSGRRTICRRR